MSFFEFVNKYNSGEINNDVTWRGYDIPPMVTPKRVRLALKLLGVRYAGELGVPHVMSLYGIFDRSRAETILGAWWVWSQLTKGRRLRGLKRREAPTLPPDPSEPVQAPLGTAERASR